MKKIAVFFCTCIILFGCTSAPKVDIQAETDAIRKLEADWTVINQTRDIEKNMTMFASEAVFMESDSPVSVGLETIRKRIESMFADTALLWETYSWTSDKIEVSASGDLAYVKGSSRMNIRTPNGIVEDVGKGVDIWKKIDGNWKAVLNIWNSDKP
jgi:ketosteroid isomerase-like protein